MKINRLFIALISVVLSVSLHMTVWAQAESNMAIPVTAQVQNGVISARGMDMAVVLSFRQNTSDSERHDIRFCAVVKNDLFDKKAKSRFRIEFYKNGNLLTEHTPILSRNGGEFVLYSSIYANGSEYLAEQGSSLYVTTVAGIPNQAWDRLEIYIETSSEYVSFGNLNYSTAFGGVSSAVDE